MLNSVLLNSAFVQFSPEKNFLMHDQADFVNKDELCDPRFKRFDVSRIKFSNFRYEKKGRVTQGARQKKKSANALTTPGPAVSGT